MPQADAINPAHYRAANGLESIDIIEAFFPDNPYRWPVLKYIFRAGRKPGQDKVQDLRKAIWWIEREIASIEQRKPAPVNGADVLAAKPFPITGIGGTDDRSWAQCACGRVRDDLCQCVPAANYRDRGVG